MLPPINVQQCPINFLVPLSVAGKIVPRVLCIQFCRRTVPEERAQVAVQNNERPRGGDVQMDTREYRTCGQVGRHGWHTIFVKRLLKNFPISCATRRSLWTTSGVHTGRMKCVWSRWTSKSFTCRVKPGFLSRACSELLCDEGEDFQQLVAKAVDWLSRNQFVQLEFLPDLTYRVTTGSGMGLLHSGDVSDAGFWIAAARWLLNTSVRRWCSLTFWRRFRDDIFAITNKFPRFKLFFFDGSALVQLARYSSRRQKMSAKARLPSWRLIATLRVARLTSQTRRKLWLVGWCRRGVATDRHARYL